MIYLIFNQLKQFITSNFLVRKIIENNYGRLWAAANVSKRKGEKSETKTEALSTDRTVNMAEFASCIVIEILISVVWMQCIYSNCIALHNWIRFEVINFINISFSHFFVVFCCACSVVALPREIINAWKTNEWKTPKMNMHHNSTNMMSEIDVAKVTSQLMPINVEK